MHCVIYSILFCGTLFFNFLIYLHMNHEWLLPSHPHRKHMKTITDVYDEYDYIIVGAGTAGCVVAYRLAQNRSLRVLLVEAGPAGNPLMDVPAAIPLLQQTAVDWQYRTVPQTHAARSAHARRVRWPRGKLVGGSGRLNNMLYVRGHPLDYAGWFPAGAATHTDALEAFLKYYWRRSEDQRGRYSNDTEWHGSGGPLTATDLPFRTRLSRQLEAVARELRIPARDLNRHYTGFDVPQVNMRAGARYSTGHYLFDALAAAPNLHLLTRVECQRVNFHPGGFEAESVTLATDTGVAVVVRARHAIVLSAGAVNTPQLLQLSGVGDAGLLAELGIETHVHLPAVGANLQDHIGAGADLVTLATPLELSASSLIDPRTMYEYVRWGSGPMTTAECEAMIIAHAECLQRVEDFAICEERLRHVRPPDLQVMVLPLGMTTDHGVQLHETIGFNSTLYEEHFASLHGTPAVLLVPILLHPKSRGYVRITSSDPRAPPLIEPRYLTHAEDVELLLKGMRFVQRIVNTRAMQELGATMDERVYPPCAKYDYDSDDYWRCYIREITLTIYHPVGTASLGTVLDYNFKVKGTNKLFVADASALPELPSGNPNAAIVTAAEIAVDHIKNELLLTLGRCGINDLFLVKHSTSIFT